MKNVQAVITGEEDEGAVDIILLLTYIILINNEGSDVMYQIGSHR